MTEVTLSLSNYDWGPLVLSTKSIVVAVGINVVLGVGASIHGHRFNPARLPDYLVDDVLPGLIALFLVLVGTVYETAWINLFAAASVTAVVYGLAPSMKRSFYELFPNIPKPVRDALDRLLPDPPAPAA